MALFTDGPISNVEELCGYDSQLGDVAKVEGIDVTRKSALAQEEIAVEVKALLGQMTPAWSDILPGRGQLALERIVVTQPLKLWHIFRTLELVYRDAYHSQLNDRYGGRRDEYHGMADWARDAVIQSGLGMSADPVRRACPPSIELVSGALPDGTYYVGIAWVNAAGEAGACSSPVMVEIAGSTIAVSHGTAPANAKGWHVYMGIGPQGLLRQSSEALPIGTPWVAPNALVEGRPASNGQAPGYMQTIARLIERG